MLIAGCVWGGTKLLSEPSAETTNDAYVSADYTLVAPRIAGQIADVLVDDNQVVKAGQLLARIDDRDYRAALASAQGELTVAMAVVSDFDAKIAQHPALVAQAQATLHSDEAAIDFARANATRYRNLSAGGAGTMEEQQHAVTALEQQQADHDRDSAALQAARQELDILRAERVNALGALARSQAALDQAKLNLSYTEIRAPIDGMVGQRSIRIGAIVSAGTPLLAVVPLSQAYVIANFQENQLARMHPHQPVRITVDSFPGLVLTGHVNSLAPATGVAFAPIAPDNATGNFTKIVQRLPVKITVDPGQPGAARLRVGLSVEPTVNVAASDASVKGTGAN
ncbi:membrane fusion protein (multidrug efflux system) [Caballeronia udeis]|uniref:Membrane fusion protein (Multidrug efflux system) n=1 Tax=Caballeronia udeis TaxID=1232866 RepID=A0ABW8MWI8_9BURK